MNPLETPPAEIEPVAILFIENVKSGRNQMVFGVRGRYEFRWSDAHQKLIRPCYSAAQFLAEQLDIRRVLTQRFTVLVLMGSPNVVTNAQESLKQLIAADRSVQNPKRRAVLVELIATAQAAVDAIDAPVPEEEPAPAEQPVEQPPVATAVELPPGWRDAQTGQRIETGGADLTPASSPEAAGGRHAELCSGISLEEERSIAKRLGIKTHNPGARTRVAMASDIVAKENGLQPA